MPGPQLTLSVRTGTRRGATVQLVPAPALLLGRDPACALVLPDDDRVSARHAQLRVQDGRVLLEDLGSTNGTVLNGVAIHAAHPIADGDLVRLGGTEVRIGLPDRTNHEGRNDGI